HQRQGSAAYLLHPYPLPVNVTPHPKKNLDPPNPYSTLDITHTKPPNQPHKPLIQSTSLPLTAFSPPRQTNHLCESSKYLTQSTQTAERDKGIPVCVCVHVCHWPFPSGRTKKARQFLPYRSARLQA
ncbi:hypothetical protein COCVIDRAFT_84199, partial [Bipolaris victoriae FI3]